MILPYFGRFNEYFQLFLDSCGNNPSFDFLIFTDDERAFRYPPNVKVVYCAFKEFKNRIQSKFEFEISLDKPYKLCDFRPAYGYVLEEEIKQYRYWGYCDCDLIFGNLEKMLLPLLGEGYDKIFCAGHLTIYRNDAGINRLFKREVEPYGQVYKTVFSEKEGFAFDEDLYKINVENIFEKHGKKIYRKNLAFNVSTKYYSFRPTDYVADEKMWKTDGRACLLYYSDGGIFLVRNARGVIKKEEFLYAHFQMRKINRIDAERLGGTILLTPKGFFTRQKMAETVKEWRSEKKVFFCRQSVRLFLRRVKKLFIKDKKRSLTDKFKTYGEKN